MTQDPAPSPAPVVVLERDHAAPLVRVEALPPDRDPVAVYLARLDSKKSRATMRAALDLVAHELGAPSPHAIPWGALRYQHAAALRSALAQRLAPATVNKVLSALRGVAREAMRLGLLPAEEFTRIADVEGVRGSRLPAGRHIEGPELVSLFGTCDRSRPQGARDAALLAVLRIGGVRRAELAALVLEDLDRAAMTARVRGKGNKERLVYLAQARPELDAWLALRGLDPGPLFCAITKGGRPTRRRLGESSIAFICERASTRAGLAKTRPHDWRRTFVGDLLDAGADLATVARLAGHAQVETTKRYDRRGERAAAKAAALLSVPRVA